MSRIGKKSIEIPEKVKLAVSDTGSIKVEGPKGKLEWVLPDSIKLRVDGKQAVLDRDDRNQSSQGASRAFAQFGLQHGCRRESGFPERP